MPSTVKVAQWNIASLIAKSHSKTMARNTPAGLPMYRNAGSNDASMAPWYWSPIARSGGDPRTCPRIRCGFHSKLTVRYHFPARSEVFPWRVMLWQLQRYEFFLHGDRQRWHRKHINRGQKLARTVQRPSATPCQSKQNHRCSGAIRSELREASGNVGSRSVLMRNNKPEARNSWIDLLQRQRCFFGRGG
jgi:hypothetical protein